LWEDKKLKEAKISNGLNLNKGRWIMEKDRDDVIAEVLGTGLILGAVALVGAVVCGIAKVIGGWAEKPVETMAKSEKLTWQEQEMIRKEKEAEEWDERGVECKEAEESGEDVCWNCRTINPNYCSCGKCIGCFGGSDYRCNPCYQWDIDSTTND